MIGRTDSSIFVGPRVRADSTRKADLRREILCSCSRKIVREPSSRLRPSASCGAASSGIASPGHGSGVPDAGVRWLTGRVMSSFRLPLLLLTVSLLPALAACDAADEPPPYRPVADVRDLMLTVVEPSAEVYWDAVGWIMDFEGTHRIRPQSEEEWEAVRNAAYTLAESGNLLMMEGRAVDDDAWIAMSQSMTDVARRAIEAAERRDEQAIFDVGAEVYYTCLNCHARYARETLRPNFEAGE